MKKMLVALLSVGLLASAAQAKTPFSIGAESVGYGATADDKGENFTSFWCGVRGYELSDLTAAYVCYQRVGNNGGLGGNGAKAVLLSGTPKLPGVFLIADIGIAMDLARDGDNTLTTAFTTGGGIAFAATEYLSPFLYASAYDAGERFTYSVHCGLAVTDIQKVIGL